MNKISFSVNILVVLAIAFASPSFCSGQLTVLDGLSLWLDANDDATLFRAEGMSSQATFGDQVLAWADKSGNENLALAIFDGPIVEETALGGQNALLFSGGEFGSGLVVDERLEVLRPYSIFIAQQNVSHGRKGRGGELGSGRLEWRPSFWIG